MTAKLTLLQARRIAIAAQGLGRRPGVPVTMRQVQGVVDRVAQFQIDSVNVAVRAHYMPLFARLGPYDRGLLDRAANRTPRRVFEFWGHAASLIDVGLEPCLRFRMSAHEARPWEFVERVRQEQPRLLVKVYEQVVQRGPITAREVEHDHERTPGGWWNWSEVKSALEWLFFIGEVTSAGRNSQFERRYDLPDRVLPPAVTSAPTPGAQESRLRLVRRSARALGVASEVCLADYFRIDRTSTRLAIQTLVRSGELEPVTVRGWDRATYLWHEAARPRKLVVDALVSPFDSLVFERRRLLDLFGVHYRIGLYTPADKRVHGYYVYLFVMDSSIAARVDLKADRSTSTLQVQAAWLEADAPEAETAARLAAELRRMAGWLGLSEVQVKPVGTLSAALAQLAPGW